MPQTAEASSRKEAWCGPYPEPSCPCGTGCTSGKCRTMSSNQRWKSLMNEGESILRLEKARRKLTVGEPAENLSRATGDPHVGECREQRTGDDRNVGQARRAKRTTEDLRRIANHRERIYTSKHRLETGLYYWMIKTHKVPGSWCKDHWMQQTMPR